MNFFDFAKANNDRPMNIFAAQHDIFEAKPATYEPKKVTFMNPPVYAVSVSQESTPSTRISTTPVQQEFPTGENIDALLSKMETDGQDLKNQMHVQSEMLKLLASQTEAFLQETEMFIRQHTQDKH